MSKRSGPETKSRILAAAEKLFSEVGFDGANVDDIAKEAGVNKALIYYYFKNKDDILDTLFTSLIDGAKQILVRNADNFKDINIEENSRMLFNTYIDFIIKKKNIIKIAIAESTKTSSTFSVVIKLGDLLVNAEIQGLQKLCQDKGIYFSSNQENLVTEFFTGIMPLFSYALYKDEWKSFYKISEEELCENFYKAFKKTHIAAHLK